VNWGNALQQDLEVMMSWTDSLPAIFLVLLAVAGLAFVARRGDWSPDQRAEFYLCGWLVVALSLEIATAHPTFERYFLLAVPFLAILAAAGVYSLGSRLVPPARPLRPALLLSLLLASSLGKRIYDDREGANWQKMEKVAAKVAEVTPAGAVLWADELTYFLMRRVPPDGMEFQYSHRLNLPEARARLLHIISDADVKKMLQAGAFDTVETCEEADWIKEWKLAELYKQKAEIKDCTVFWDKTVPKK
jgi:4-amino-4-deoxy-L-arabinose transferase-like glycosyltransferase